MKKVFSLLFVLGVSLNLFSQNFEGTRRPANPDFLKYISSLNAGTFKTETSDGHRLGYIPSPAKPDFSHFLIQQSKLKSAKSFPASYDMRSLGYVTSVKNQGQCGSCWTFGTCASIESRWKILGLGTFDLSENNIKDCHHFVWGPCDGGNALISTTYLSTLAGPVLEATDKYVAAAAACPTGKAPIAYVSDARFLPNDMNTIKQALMDYGALYITYFHDDAYLRTSDDTYYCNDAAQQQNHAVTLVGWDDNKATAGGTGAWLVKNSWGSSWGLSGYFYISYKDATVLGENAYFPIKLDYKTASKVYYYADQGYCTDWGYDNETAYALVKYSPSDNNPLNKIGTWINTADATVDISVYDSFDGTTLSGLLATIPTQTCPFPGYYTFDLPSSVVLNPCKDFFIKVKYYTPGNNLPIPVEALEMGYSNPTIETGKCWTGSDGKTWKAIGVGTQNQYDLCINAYAYSDCTPPQAAITYSGSLNLCGGQSVALNANTGNQFKYQWQHNGTCMPGATNSVFNASEQGDYSVFISDNSGCSKTSPVVTVSVFNINAGSDKNINCNDSIKLTPDITITTGNFVKVYAPKSVTYTNIGVAQFGADILTSFAAANALYIKDNSGAYTGCSSTGYPKGSFKNKIAIIDRGGSGCEFGLKSLNAQKAGAIGVIIVNNVAGAGVISMAAGSYGSQVTIPAVMLSYEDGAAIKKIITDSGYVKVSIGFDAEFIKFSWSPADGLSGTDIFSPYAKPKINTAYSFSVTTSSCTVTDKVNVNILNAPKINIGKDTAIYADQNITINAGSGFKTYFWNNSSSSQSLTLPANSLNAGEYLYSVTVTDNYGCKDADTIKVTVSKPGFHIMGFVVYDNTAQTPVPNAIVNAYGGENIIAGSAKSDAAGHFDIGGLSNGTYKLSVVCNSRWGGGDPTDGLIINKYFVKLYSINDELERKAADVNGDDAASPQDALMINRRFISIISAFTVNDWISEILNITVNGSNLNQNIKVLCAGDVNASFKP